MKRYRAIAEYYDFEWASQEMLEHDVPFLLDHMPRRRCSVLELAVGTARAAIPLAQAGHRVVGVDYADDLLQIAARKRDAAGLRHDQLELIQADIRDVRLGRAFDWVCLLFNTFLAFPSLEEQDRLLQSVLRHMNPRGRFWLDIFQPALAVFPQDVERNLDPIAFYVPRLDRTVFKTTEVKRDLLAQVEHVTFHYRWFDADGNEHHERTSFDMTAMFPRELQVLLERNGLKVDHMFGNYDGSEVTSRSPRIIASCRRMPHRNPAPDASRQRA